MKKIKVLHVTFDMTIGGAQQVIRQLVENMDASKIESEIVCIDNKLGELGEILQQKCIKIHLLNRQKGIDFQLIKQLYQLIKARNIDVVHCHQYSPYVYGLLSSILTTAKVIFTEHGRFYPDYGTWKRKLINPVFNLFTAKIIAISQATKYALIQFENFKASDIDVIYNGIQDNSNIKVDEAALRAQFGIPDKSFIFGTISRLQPIKNQSMMIRAFKKVNDRHKEATHLLIVGDGEKKKDLEALVDELNIVNKVTFTGFQKEPYHFHKIIKVFLLSSFSEGTSMTLLESQSFSTPCIVTGVGGNEEVVINKETGLVVDNDDVNQFSVAMMDLISNENRIASYGLRARQEYLTKFSIDKMLHSYLKMYLEKK